MQVQQTSILCRSPIVIMNVKHMQNIENKVGIVGIHTFTTRNVETGKITNQVTVKNLIATVGRGALASVLAGTGTYTGEVTYGALGSSSTAPANGDTQLGAEIVGGRVATSSQTYASNIAYISFFFPDGTLITYAEFANFIDGTATINSGQLFTHVALSGTKAANESLTVDCTYTIT